MPLQGSRGRRGEVVKRGKSLALRPQTVDSAIDAVELRASRARLIKKSLWNRIGPNAPRAL
jgi:hypothetical protein